MNDNLAVSLLAKVTKWDDKRLSKELPKLSFMARTKYDSYSQFDPGFRFMSSFAQWMSQFDKEDVEVIYSAFNKHLTFISSEQIKYLVDLMYRIPSIIIQNLVVMDMTVIRSVCLGVWAGD